MYYGSRGSYTPGHCDILGTLGHNLMLDAEEDSGAIWFCIASKDQDKAEALWKAHEQDLHADNSFLPIAALKEANFPIYIIDQKPGDLVLIPSNGAHQVMNYGAASLKFAWNRLDIKILDSVMETLVRKKLGKKKFFFLVFFFFIFLCLMQKS